MQPRDFKERSLICWLKMLEGTFLPPLEHILYGGVKMNRRPPKRVGAGRHGASVSFTSCLWHREQEHENNTVAAASKEARRPALGRRLSCPRPRPTGTAHCGAQARRYQRSDGGGGGVVAGLGLRRAPPSGSVARRGGWAGWSNLDGEGGHKPIWEGSWTDWLEFRSGGTRGPWDIWVSGPTMRLGILLRLMPMEDIVVWDG